MPWYLAAYKPEKPMMGKRGKWLAWHPDKRQFEAETDAIAMRLVHHIGPQNGGDPVVWRTGYDQNGKFYKIRVS